MADPICPEFPQLDFTFRLDRLTPQDWLTLGELDALVRSLRGIPLKPELARQLHTTSLVKGAAATTSIEGNSLSESEVRAVMEKRFTADGPRRYQQREVENTIQAFNDTLHFVETEDHPDPETFVERMKAWNRTIVSGLEDVLEDHVVPGEFKQVRLGVGRSPTPGPAYTHALMIRLAAWIPELSSGLREAGYVAAARYVVPLMAHLYFECIHPFGDGNGRTGRMLEFYLLLRAGVPTIAAHLTSSHYNESRDHGYYRTLERFAIGRDPLPFLQYALAGFRDRLRAQLDVVGQHVRDVAWRSLVYETLPARTPAEERQRSLVFALTERGDWVTRTSGEAMDSAAMYFISTPPKTRTRDIHALRDKGLIEVSPRGVRARTELINAFLPRSFERAG